MREFNRGQKEAIEHVKGPVMALAGPGSGKTTTMVYRIKNLIENAGIKPYNILVITFTRASAAEMEHRFNVITGNEIKGVTFGTFHSVFFYILKLAYGYNVNNILREDEKNQIIKDLIKKYGIETEEEEDLIELLSCEISMIKGDMIGLDTYYSPSVGEDEFRNIFKDYENKKCAAGKLDFDDMLVYCYELLKERKDILDNLRKKYKYILVDEFQDINRIQYEITRLLALPENNLFIVGDDDQSIYGFRGSRPEIMLGFEKDYPGTKKTVFDINYRCSKNITKAAGKLISNNTRRFGKNIVSEKGYGQAVKVHHVSGIKEENSHMLKEIEKCVKSGIPYEEIAVITRTNIEARPVIAAFMKYNIPFYVRDRVPCIYDHFVVANIFDYIKMARGNRDCSIFIRIMNKPKRYIRRDDIRGGKISFEELKRIYSDKGYMIDKINKLEYDLEVINKLSPKKAVKYIRKVVGYDSYLKEYAEYRHIDCEGLYSILDELEDLSDIYKTFDDWEAGIAIYRQELERHSKYKGDDAGINITTMHSAKGLEFDAVFILNANEGMTPYKKAHLPSEIEEERRMFYVAMTRARDFLHIYELKKHYNKRMKPSRFIAELLD